MRIKKYVAKSMKVALMSIMAELGEDAVILKTTKIQKGPFGLGSSPIEFEVTAGVDEGLGSGPEEIEVTAGVDDGAQARR